MNLEGTTMPGMPLDATITHAAAALREAQRVVVFTGAGMSADSGIATFRDALTGLWARFDPQALATPEGFDADPPLVWGWYEARRLQVRQAQPNAGHAAVARLVAQRHGWLVVTQNVDDLHERAAAAAGVAGDRGVVHLHGSLFAARCHHCAAPFALPDHAVGTPVGDAGRLAPPPCAGCGGPVRPGVVWFGEALPQRAWARAEAAVAQADAMLVIGTSGVVYPAAGLVTQALKAGQPVWVVDPDAGSADRHAGMHHLRGRAADVLPRLAAAMGG
jgi:NAD-dependent deacetylase